MAGRPSSRRLIGEHSEKPDVFYDIVAPTYGEAFQRKAREGFTNLYIEEKCEAAEGPLLLGDVEYGTRRNPRRHP
jgi:hypothetical protein